MPEYIPFAERIGITKPKTIQLNSMDTDLKNSLWNAIYIKFFADYKGSIRDVNSTLIAGMIHDIYLDFYKEPIDNIPYYIGEAIEEISNRYFSEFNYIKVYSFIDFLIHKVEDSNDTFIPMVNFVLKRELSGYRIINGLLTPITSEIELLEIETASNNTKDTKYDPVYQHLLNSQKQLSNKENPDYRNSIKESVLALESLCKIITNQKNADLSKALLKLKETIKINRSLEEAIIKLYAFSSGNIGIRHALIDESELEHEDAIFFLVVCSAFTNYIIAKTELK